MRFAAKVQRGFRLELLRQGTKHDAPQFSEPVLAPPLKFFRRLWQRIRGHRHEQLIDPRVDFVSRQCVGKSAQLFALDDRQLRLGDGRVAALEMPGDPAIRHQPQLGIIVVAARRDADVEELLGSVGIETVELFQPRADAVIAVHREDRVVAGVFEQQWARRDEGRDAGPRPLERVDEEHAVAMAVDDRLADVIFEIVHAADGHRDLHALVGCGDPE